MEEGLAAPPVLPIFHVLCVLCVLCGEIAFHCPELAGSARAESLSPEPLTTLAGQLQGVFKATIRASAGELAGMLKFDLAAVTAALEELVRYGYLEPAPEVGADVYRLAGR